MQFSKHLEKNLGKFLGIFVHLAPGALSLSQ